MRQHANASFAKITLGSKVGSLLRDKRSRLEVVLRVLAARFASGP
jgi:hypothetical protein